MKVRDHNPLTTPTMYSGKAPNAWNTIKAKDDPDQRLFVVCMVEHVLSKRPDLRGIATHVYQCGRFPGSYRDKRWKVERPHLKARREHQELLRTLTRHVGNIEGGTIASRAIREAKSA